MSIRLQRFDFGSLQDFRGPVVTEVIEETLVEEVEAPPPPPTFSESDVEVARSTAQKLGYAEGFEAGIAHAAEQADAKRQTIDASLTRLGGLLNGLQHSYQQLLEREATDLSQLILMIARKVAGEALKNAGDEALTALVQQCLPVILSKPKLAIELNPESFEPTIDRIESILEASGYEGEIQFRANPALGTNDITLDWVSGQASRNVETLWEEIEALCASLPITITPPSAEQTEPAPAAPPTPPTA